MEVARYSTSWVNLTWGFRCYPSAPFPKTKLFLMGSCWSLVMLITLLLYWCILLGCGRCYTPLCNSFILVDSLLLLIISWERCCALSLGC